MSEDLTLKIKEMIITALNLEDITPDDIDTEAPLFNDGLGLDSIDALELGLAMKNTFGVTINPESEDVKRHFYSVKTLREYIEESKN
ncbi:phosphopantetheine-binding protein [Succinimonas amylolytica]|uniref:phosphopantetheine-binding protein n=1 Tax=Succinimonas amylolytica TaxID=83769 RepID=UPI00035F04CD|nr:phosphopantetheine-binding protein [Succinimonas amylolytica]